MQTPSLETEQIATALRLGWYFTELRGRHDNAVYREPRPAVVSAEDSLCLGDERSPYAQAAEVAAIVGAAAADLHANPPVPPSVCATAKGETASDRLAELSAALRGSDRSLAKEARQELEQLLVHWDEAIQVSLAVDSPRVAAAYRLGRALADVRWSLHPSDVDDEMHGWRFLLGEWRLEMMTRLLDRLSPYFSDKATPVALKRSIQAWAKVLPAILEKGVEDAAKKLADQSEVWHDLLLSERSATDLVDHDLESVVRHPSVLLLAMKPFRLEIVLLALSFLGLIAASWLVFTNTPTPPPGEAMGTAPAAQSLVGLAQNIGGRSAVSAVIATMSLFGLTLAGLSARAKARLQGLVAGIQEGIDTVLAVEATTMLPGTIWPLQPEGNLYLRFATIPQRLGAVVLDWMLLIACDLIVIFAAWLLLSFFAVGPFALRNTVVLASLLMALLYFSGWPEGRSRGIGMWIQRMRILDKEDGCVPDSHQTMKRALSVVVPFELTAIAFWLWPYGWWMAVPLALAAVWLLVLCWTIAVHRDESGERDGRGWHDLLARTIVVAATDRAYDFATIARPRPTRASDDEAAVLDPAEAARDRGESAAERRHQRRHTAH